MIFLADIVIIDDNHYRIIRDDKQKNKKQKKNKKKPTKQKKSGFTKLANKTAGMTKFSEGEIAVVKSIAANNVKAPLNNKEGKQKTIGAKKSTKYHRSM